MAIEGVGEYKRVRRVGCGSGMPSAGAAPMSWPSEPVGLAPLPSGESEGDELDAMPVCPALAALSPYPRLPS